MPPLNANRVTRQWFARNGKVMMRKDPECKEGVDFQRAYREMFGCSPLVCVVLWRHCQARRLYKDASPRHVLWTLLFLKVYAKKTPLCAIAGTTPPTFRKWVRRFIPSIRALAPRVVCATTFLSVFPSLQTDTVFGSCRSSCQTGLSLGPLAMAIGQPR